MLIPTHARPQDVHRPATRARRQLIGAASVVPKRRVADDLTVRLGHAIGRIAGRPSRDHCREPVQIGVRERGWRASPDTGPSAFDFPGTLLGVPSAERFHRKRTWPSSEVDTPTVYPLLPTARQGTAKV